MKTKRFLQFFVIVVLGLMTLSPIPVNAQSPQVLYVVQGGQTSGLCDSWANACELQYALTSSVSGQGIWVAAGVYKPTTNPTDRAATFQLQSGVGLYGGFAGTETSRDQRDWETNKTILSGDIDNNDINNDGNFIAENTADIQGGNVYHVVAGTTAVLDGFIITAGQTNCQSWNPDCLGGGMINGGFSSPTLTNVIFSANMAYRGGGIYSEGFSNLALTNVAFFANSAYEGGGMFNHQATRATLTNVTFYSNSATFGGGMIISNTGYSSAATTLTNVTFSANIADYGGGIFHVGDGPLNVINSIFWGNNASNGAAIYIYYAYFTPDIKFADMQGGWPGTGNIDADPLFVDPANGDLHLQAGSPAIDSATNNGCPSTDFDGAPRFQDGNNDGIFKCDMGAFEFPGAIPPSLPPIADAGGPYTANEGETFILDASNSYDPEGGPLTYEWDLNNDGQYDDATGVTADTSFANAGNYIVGLRVTDTDGLSDIDTADVTINAPPPNDNFANAINIEALPYTNTQDTTYATSSPDDPTTCTNNGSVWYRVTATSDSLIDADTFGSGYDTVLSVYTGEPGSLVQVTGGCNDDYNGLQSRVTFNATVGTTYYFMIGICCGNGGSGGGNLQFNVKEITPPANDDFGNATLIGSLPYSDTVDITGASLEADEPNSSCAGYGSLWKTVWYAYTPESSGVVAASVPSATFAPVLAVYTGDSLTNLTELGCQVFSGNPVTFPVSAGTTYYFQVGKYTSWDPDGQMLFQLEEKHPPANDNFGNATSIGSLPYSDTVDITDATTEPNEPQNCYSSPKTVWYSFTPTANMLIQADMSGSSFGDTVFNVYQATGPNITDLSFMQCAYFGNSATFNVQAGQTYYIQAGSIYGSSGNLQLNLQELPRPANDDFGSAITINALPYTDSRDTTYATSSTDDPTTCSNNGSVWYRYTPLNDSLIDADTIGSNYDTVLSVFTGSPGAFVQVTGGCNDDYYGLQSRVTFTATAGTTYYFMVGRCCGNGGSGGGNLQINLKELPRPANDDFANATIVSLPLPFDHTVDTQYSSRQTGEPTPTCAYYGPGSRSVWYAFTPATSGSVSASIPSAAFTPVLAVYTGNSLNSLTQIGCQTYSNLLTFRANAGTTYYFQVGNLYYWEQGGSMQFHLDVTPPPTAGFYYYPPDPSVFDTIQFYDQSYDPGQVGFQSFSWDFGDGETSTAAYPTHKYMRDGDYTVQHSVTTADGRTASITQVVHVKTHDVAITRINAPQSASAGQTRNIPVSVNSKGYSETVRVDLYKSVPGGFEFVSSITLAVPAYSTNRTTSFNFTYTFTSSDATIGKVTFKAVATIVNARDAYPSDNEAISSPPTRVSRGR